MDYFRNKVASFNLLLLYFFAFFIVWSSFFLGWNSSSAYEIFIFFLLNFLFLTFQLYSIFKNAEKNFFETPIFFICFLILQLSFFYILENARIIYSILLLFSYSFLALFRTSFLWKINILLLLLELLLAFSIKIFEFQNTTFWHDVLSVFLRFTLFFTIFLGSKFIEINQLKFEKIMEIVEKQKNDLEVINKKLEEKSEAIRLKSRQLMEELSLAQQIQLQFLPSILPKLKYTRFSTLYKPMEEIGGDFYDVFHLKDKDLVGIFISDVSGHGVPAALITSMIKTILDTAEEKLSSPAQLLTHINTKMAVHENGRYLTAFYGIYNSKTNKMIYSRAAHPFPWLIREGQILELKGKGAILGMFDKIQLEEKEIELKAGDKLIFYTDGLIDATSPSGVKFEKIIPDILIQNEFLSIEEIVQNLYYRLLDHCEEFNFNDDVCIVGMEITEGEQNES